mmetsp:Transcript_2274/g.3304  ORF Transcript_2274/g.3304 Transcript_2274/m.3304 type:complete len:148 (-) Transcript_2274:2-445(-)
MAHTTGFVDCSIALQIEVRLGTSSSPPTLESLFPNSAMSAPAEKCLLLYPPVRTIAVTAGLDRADWRDENIWRLVDLPSGLTPLFLPAEISMIQMLSFEADDDVDVEVFIFGTNDQMIIGLEEDDCFVIAAIRIGVFGQWQCCHGKT